MSYTILSTEYAESQFKLHVSIPGTELLSTYTPRLNTLVQELGPTIKGFRPGKANPEALKKRFAPRAIKETISVALDQILQEVMEAEGIIGLGEVQVQHTPWDTVSDLEALASLPAFKLLPIDVSVVQRAVETTARPEQPAEARALLLSALVSSIPIEVDSAVASIPQQAAPVEGNKDFKQRVRETLLLDSLARQLEIEITDAEQEQKLVELAVDSGLSMLEVEDYLEQPGVAETVYLDTRRDKALDVLSGIVWS